MDTIRRFKFRCLHLTTILAFTTFCLLCGCNPATIYKAPDFVVYQVDHRNVAIVPFEVSINPTNKSKM